MELLIAYMEISIAVLAFSSIAAQFKNHHTVWNTHQYQGIIGHSIQAFVYASIPMLMQEFDIETRTLWLICTTILGVFTFGQSIVVWFMDKISRKRIKLLLIFLSALVLLLQLSYGFNFVTKPLAVYQVGIFFHILQSLVLVTQFIFNPQD